jgi:type I restriction-modification system DNA methylase subunit
LSARITERTLYEYIEKVFDKYGWRCFSETSVGEQFPDLIIEGDGTRVISEVKIDSEIQLTKAIIDADQKARKLGTRNAVALLFPSYIREILPSELERNYARLPVCALVLTDWLAERKDLTLESLAEAFTTSFRDWVETKKTRVSYDLVVDVARDSIREIAGYLRQSLSQKPVLDSAMAVVGRFDIYKSLLEDFSGVKENEARLYIADITSYILVNQLLFYHIISERLGYNRLPDVDPMNPPKDFLDVLEHTLKKGREVYPHILGFDLFPVLRGDLRIVWSIARVVSTLKALRPQHIKEDLFGRLYHETIPPETRKNLGAFYTKPEAARLLAALAIDKWDAKVLDPACGSGTLLVEAYQRKAQLAPPMSREKLHEKFIGDIYGIDVMHFASHMTSMNLTAQNIEVPLKPHVVSQDGIKTMVESARENEGDNDPPKIAEQSITKWLKIMREERIPKDFDVVIMNPPFTRRERIPAKKEDLERLVPEVKGKTGYWAYFLPTSEKLLAENGILAVVIPEEFFVGKSAKSVRKYLFENGYAIKYIARSAVEVAFSESAHYRDYLIVLQKSARNENLILLVVKKKLDDLRGKIDKIALRVMEFKTSSDKKLNSEEISLLKIANVKDFVNRHIGNLKPLVGFNTPKAYTLVIELLDELKDNPTIGDLINEKKIEVKVYNPGQFTTKGIEPFARKLFVSRYGARSPNTIFFIESMDNKKASIRVRRTKASFKIPMSSTVSSLRTYSKVRHLDITDEEEIAIIDAELIPHETLKMASLLPLNDAIKATKDISSAYDHLSGNILLVRKVRLTSPDFFWTAFFSNKRMLGTTSALLNMNIADHKMTVPLILYLNSTITFLQLISLMAETEGAWVTFHGRQVWNHIHTPTSERLNKIANKAQKVFKNVSKVDVKSLFVRIKEHDPIQREIDELALEMLGIENWKPRLDEIYDAVAKELETMHKILETSRKPSKKTKNATEKEEKLEKTATITKWFEGS